MTKEMKIPGAYVITHVATGMKYIGSTANLYARKKHHLYALRDGRHANRFLQEAYRADSRLLFMLFQSRDREHAFELEQELLDEFGPLKQVFNVARAITREQVRPDHRKKKPEELIKSSIVLPTRIDLAEEGLDLSEFQQSQGLPDETRRKMREAHRVKSRPVTIEGVTYRGIWEAAEKLDIPYLIISSRIRNKSERFKSWHWSDRVELF